MPRVFFDTFKNDITGESKGLYMLTTEVRACIIDDDREKAQQLARFIGEQGGEVVGFMHTSARARNATIDRKSPERQLLTDANVVLLDGHLEPGDRKGTSGREVFEELLWPGIAHPASVPDDLGAVVISCSGMHGSQVEVAAGAGLRPYEQEAQAHWQRTLLPHAAEPTRMPHDSIGRQRWHTDRLALEISGLYPYETKGSLLVLAKTAMVEGVGLVHESTQPRTYMPPEDAFAWLSAEPVKPTDDIYARALAVTDSRMHVVTYSRHTEQGQLRHEVALDQIDTSVLSELPEAYWSHLNINPHSLGIHV